MLAMGDLFSLRAAQDADLDLLSAYAHAEGMDALPSIEGIIVAVNDNDEPVGFIRIVEEAGFPAHVNPVVVYPSWRGYGVGRALMDEARRVYGELRLVSRGSSQGFYDALGLAPCSWEDICPSVFDDCAGCEMFDECAPQPMTTEQR